MSRRTTSLQRTKWLAQCVLYSEVPLCIIYHFYKNYVNYILSQTYHNRIFLYQLEVGERLDRLEELTTDTQDLGTTEVIISVSILVNTTDFVLQNDSVIKYNYFHDELLLY